LPSPDGTACAPTAFAPEAWGRPLAAGLDLLVSRDPAGTLFGGDNGASQVPGEILMDLCRAL